MININNLEYSDMDISLRPDLYHLFKNTIKDFFEESNCNFINHNIIKGYKTSKPMISSFTSHERWMELYWEKYRNQDSTEKRLHNNIFNGKISFISLNLSDPQDQCTEDRLKYCGITNGFKVALSHNEDVIENMMFGWKNSNIQELSIEKISKICRGLKPLRDFHLEKGLRSLALNFK